MGMQKRAYPRVQLVIVPAGPAEESFSLSRDLEFESLLKDLFFPVHLDVYRHSARCLSKHATRRPVLGQNIIPNRTQPPLVNSACSQARAYAHVLFAVRSDSPSASAASTFDIPAKK